MVEGRVRRLERALLLERAEAIVPQIVRQYLEDWDPDDWEYSLDLGIQLSRAGITLHSYCHSQARTYLENCYRRRIEPNPKTIVYSLLPWTARL